MTAPRTTFEVLTLFPAAVQSFVAAGLLGKAIERGLVAVHCTDIRTFTTDKHRTVDDAPFGGGAGMVIKPEPVVAALESIAAERGPMHRILLTPSAPRFDQRVAERLATMPRIALLCGRYEGIDDRVREHFVDECLSLGDFVLGGGEVAALAIIEAVARLGEGVVGNPASITGDSFAADPAGPLLEYPQYTRPAVFRGHAVPEVLLGGDHGAIERWRKTAALRRTWHLRPELRPREPLPVGFPIHLAVDATELDDALQLADLVRAHDLAGLVLLGADDEQTIAWTRATAGRCRLTAFADLKTMRRRLKQPWIVATTAEPAAGLVPEPVTGADELLDVLRTCTRAQASGLVLVAGARAEPSSEPSSDVDARWALVSPPAANETRASTHDDDRAPGAASEVAPPVRIADPSPPSTRAALVVRALASLAAWRSSPATTPERG